MRPFNSSNANNIYLSLGMPWLHATDTKIRVNSSMIKMGDFKKEEIKVKIF